MIADFLDHPDAERTNDRVDYCDGNRDRLANSVAPIGLSEPSVADIVRILRVESRDPSFAVTLINSGALPLRRKHTVDCRVLRIIGSVHNTVNHEN